jgi:hypothetical protein
VGVRWSPSYAYHYMFVSLIRIPLHVLTLIPLNVLRLIRLDSHTHTTMCLKSRTHTTICLKSFQSFLASLGIKQVVPRAYQLLTILCLMPSYQYIIPLSSFLFTLPTMALS